MRRITGHVSQKVSSIQQTIDVWDVQTFDDDLIKQLDAYTDLIRDYFENDHQIFLAHDLGRHGLTRLMLRPTNKYLSNFNDLLNKIDMQMRARTIRAFHYTRLTDDEIAALQQNGIHLSTPEALRQRLEAIVGSGKMTHEAAAWLYSESPFHSNQLNCRLGKFWLTSHPVVVDDPSVKPFLEHWGGEAASMWVRDSPFSTILRNIGRARIIEVAVPLSDTKHSYWAGKAVVATFARSRGVIASKFAFDLYVETVLPSTALIAIHTQGDLGFISIGCDCHQGFVDIDVNKWEELTRGED